MTDDTTLHPAFKATLDKFCADAGRAKHDPEAAAAAFAEAVARLMVKARDASADIIGHTHVLFHKRARMSPAQIAMELDNLRDAMRELNGSFAQLELAHSATTLGETAARIRRAAEPSTSKAAFDELETELMRTMGSPS